MKLSTATLIVSIVITAMMFIVWYGVATALEVNEPAFYCGCFLVGWFGADTAK